MNLYHRSSHTETVVNALNATVFYSRGCLVTRKIIVSPQTLICGTSSLEGGPLLHLLTVLFSILFDYYLGNDILHIKIEIPTY